MTSLTFLVNPKYATLFKAQNNFQCPLLRHLDTPLLFLHIKATRILTSSIFYLLYVPISSFNFQFPYPHIGMPRISFHFWDYYFYLVDSTNVWTKEKRKNIWNHLPWQTQYNPVIFFEALRLSYSRMVSFSWRHPTLPPQEKNEQVGITASSGCVLPRQRVSLYLWWIHSSTASMAQLCHVPTT